MRGAMQSTLLADQALAGGMALRGLKASAGSANLGLALDSQGFAVNGPLAIDAAAQRLANGGLALGDARLEAGADDYITKPLHLADLDGRIDRALESRATKTRLELLENEVRDRHRFDNMIGRSAAMQRVFRDQLVERTADYAERIRGLRQRIDATEAFAADVAHEIKNPLASLSSAAEGLRTVTKPELRAKLQDIITEDVYRLDRLITDIADLSRIDAKLARTRFEPVDIGKLIENLLQLRKARAQTENVEIAFARPHAGTAMVMGDPSQLSRVIENLLANAISFSPPGGVVRIAATRIFERVIVTVDDDGPGIPENAREAVFERFHSDRRGDEAFGKHSGLGLSIARTIVNGHNGSIEAVSREPGQQGARIEFRLPALEV